MVSWNIETLHEPWRELVEMGADVPICSAVPDAHSVCHGFRPPLQQSPRGCRVSCVDLVIAALNIYDYECSLLHLPDPGVGPVPGKWILPGLLSPQAYKRGSPWRPPSTRSEVFRP